MDITERPDYIKVLNLFRELGIEYELKTYDDDGLPRILLPTGNRHIGGYSSFLSEYVFTKDGKFIEVNNWE